MDVGTLQARITADLSNFNAGIAQAQTRMTGFGQNMTKTLNMTAQKIRTFGYLSSAVITLPMVMAGKAAFNMAKDYEFSIQKIVGLAGVAQDAVNKFSKEVLALAPIVGKGPKDLAEALYFISSSGIKGAQTMDVLKLSAKAAASGMGETKAIADLLTSVLNAYRGTGMTAAKATDILTAAVREGKGEADAFAGSIGQIIPIAASLGVSFDQVAGGMAAITLTGASASTAAVYLKGMFNALRTASPQGNAALKSVGSSYAKLREILAKKGVIGLLKEVRDITTAGGEFNDEFLAKIFPNVRAVTGVLSLMGKNFQYNTELMNKVTNSTGSLGVALAAVSMTIKMRYDKAISQVNVSQIQFGKILAEGLLPIIEKLANWLSNITKRWEGFSEAQKSTRLTILAIVAALGPVALILSTVIYAFTGLFNIIKGGVQVVIWLTKAFIGQVEWMAKTRTGIMLLNGAEALYGKTVAWLTKLHASLTAAIVSKMSVNGAAAATTVTYTATLLTNTAATAANTTSQLALVGATTAVATATGVATLNTAIWNAFIMGQIAMMPKMLGGFRALTGGQLALSASTSISSIATKAQLALMPHIAAGATKAAAATGVWATVTRVFTAGAGAATVATRAFAAAISTSLIVTGILAIVAAIVALIVVISRAVRSHREYNAAQKILIAINAETNKKIAEEITKLDILSNALANTNVHGAVRSRLIKEWNDNYGELLGYMLTEKSTAEDIAKAYQLTNGALREKLLLEGKLKIATVAGESLTEKQSALANKENALALLQSAQEIQDKALSKAHPGKDIENYYVNEDFNRKGMIRALTHETVLIRGEIVPLKKAYDDALVAYETKREELTKSINKPSSDGGIDRSVAQYQILLSAVEDFDKQLKELLPSESWRAPDIRANLEKAQAELDAFLGKSNKAAIQDKKDFFDTDLQLAENHARATIFVEEDLATELAQIRIDNKKAEMLAETDTSKQLKLNADYEGLVIDETNRQKKIAWGKLYDERVKGYELENIAADEQAKKTILDADTLARQLVANEIEKQQKLLWLREMKGEDITIPQAELDVKKQENSKPYIEAQYAKARALINWQNTADGVYADITKRQHEGLIDDVQAIQLRREAQIKYYDFINSSAENTASFLRGLTREELNHTISNLDAQLQYYKGTDKEKAIVDALATARVTKATDDQTKIIAEFATRMADLTNQLMTDMAVGLGESIGNMLGGQDFSFKNILKTFGEFVKGMGALFIAYGVAAMGFHDALSSVIGAGAAIAAGIALVAIGTVIVSKAGSDTVAMADGGLLYGPTNVLAGEYQGARNNPEVFAPLNKLQDMIQPAGGGYSERLVTEISGRKLQVILVREDQYQKRGKR